jgi:hypothetical protein
MQLAILKPHKQERETDSWMPIDLHVELLNLELKLIFTARRNRTFGVDELSKTAFFYVITPRL